MRTGFDPQTNAQRDARVWEQDSLWALKFSNFMDRGKLDPDTSAPIQGAFLKTPKSHAGHPDGKALGEDIVIAHCDTGYSPHPELLHGDSILEGVDTIVAQPSLLGQAIHIKNSIEDIGQSIEDTANRTWDYGASVVNGTPIPAAAVPPPARSVGMDPLIGAFDGHGPKTGSTIVSGLGAPSQGEINIYKAIPVNHPTGCDTIQPNMGAPDYHPIVGSAPNAKLLSIRMTDMVVVDPNVAQNLKAAFQHVCAVRARSINAIDVGVISISLGHPGGGRDSDLEKLIDALTDQGVIICAAAAQGQIPGLDDALKALETTTADGADVSDAVSDELRYYKNYFRGNALILEYLNKTYNQNFETIDDASTWLVERFRSAGDSLESAQGYADDLVSKLRWTSAAAKGLGTPAFPGADPSVICCAACDSLGDAMADGLYGNEVTISTPGVNVWKADSSNHEVSGKYVHKVGNGGNGTSYATAITAGTCALWQAHHGREYLLDTYGAPFLYFLFLYALKESADPFPGTPSVATNLERGFGLLDADALLDEPLPQDTNTLCNLLLTDPRVHPETKMRLHAKMLQFPQHLGGGN